MRGVRRVALIGGVFLWAGVELGDWRRIVFGVSLAVAWPSPRSMTKKPREPNPWFVE
jgi:hypothetical protein